MNKPVVFLLQFLAWLMLIAVVIATWAGVTYPSERAKAHLSAFAKIHPMCFHRAFLDERYEAKINLEICHAEFKNYPIHIRETQTYTGDSEIIEVSSSKATPDGTLTVGYRMVNIDQLGSFPMTLFHKFPDGTEYNSLAGASFNAETKELSAHFMAEGNDRCNGGYIDTHGALSNSAIAVSHAATLSVILNPLSRFFFEVQTRVVDNFPEWELSKVIDNNPIHCVGRLIGSYNWRTEEATLHAVAIDLNSLIAMPNTKTESCIADSIVRTSIGNPTSSPPYTIFSLDEWSQILERVNQRCGNDTAFIPLHLGI